MRIVIAGPDETALTSTAYPALTSAGFEVMGVVDDPAQLRDIAATGVPDVILVDAHIAITPDEAVQLISYIASLTPVAVILPEDWKSLRDAFGQNLVAGFESYRIVNLVKIVNLYI